jgi:hypothetical protein
MDIFVGLAAVLMVIGMLAFIVSPRTGRGLDFFGSGFVPYRGPGWPQGVQEEDPVPWSWSTGRNAEVPEFHEINGDGAPTASAVDRGSMLEGMARRRR